MVCSGGALRGFMKRLQVKGVGPIRHADVTFGDLTVLVGPQASGKSIFVQLFKAIEDAGDIRDDLKRYGFDWSRGDDPVRDFCSIYFGGGMEGVLSESASIVRDGKRVDFKRIAKPVTRKAPTEATVFLIPAQRVLVLQDGWPKPFMAYSTGDPYCLRYFSEALRWLMDLGYERNAALSPLPLSFTHELGPLISEAIYAGATLERETQEMRKRVVLKPPRSNAALPYSAWSAGQREFTPLLLGLCWITDPAHRLEPAPEAVIIEEPEMGLHPQAIVSFGLIVLDLLQTGHKVIISTHSPVILDLVWALRELSRANRTVAKKAMLRIFGLDRMTNALYRVFNAALEKSYRTYFFNRTPDGVVTKDISTLDPGDDDEMISGWGGLSGFSGRIAQIVGEALSQ